MSNSARDLRRRSRRRSETLPECNNFGALCIPDMPIKSPQKPTFAALGRQTGRIDVRLSYRIVELFSEGLYASPNKAIEELVANAFDAGALNVQLLLSANLNEQTATIAVIDDGEGMNGKELKQHWLIGSSNKRQLAVLPRGRQQIGKFGIGKLATYVLAGRLTHITKADGKYFSTSMDYSLINRSRSNEVAAKSTIRIPLRILTESDAKEALSSWTDTAAFKKAGLRLFGSRAVPSWTVAIMSSLKPKVQELKLGTLEWVLRTALPLRPDFSIWVNQEKLVSSKEGRGLERKWILGKDLVELPRPTPKDVTSFENKSVDASSEYWRRMVEPFTLSVKIPFGARTFVIQLLFQRLQSCLGYGLMRAVHERCQRTDDICLRRCKRAGAQQ